MGIHMDLKGRYKERDVFHTKCLIWVAWMTGDSQVIFTYHSEMLNYWIMSSKMHIY